MTQAIRARASNRAASVVHAPILTDGDLVSNAASYARHLRAANLSPIRGSDLAPASPITKTIDGTQRCTLTWKPVCMSHLAWTGPSWS